MVVDDFLEPETARELRLALEAHFGQPHQHSPAIHQIWNYWYVPNLYTYLRTHPEKVFSAGHVRQFEERLRSWSISSLGLGAISGAYLSLYVDGCRQGLHNDARNGRFGFVYSLTKLDRQTIGGETILLEEGDLVRRNVGQANAGTGFYQLVEPRFNRLVVFDDRLVHGVERVDGSMDPLEGRCVLHGHIQESGPITEGPLSVDATREPVKAAVGKFARHCLARITLFHGPLVVRIRIEPDGRVSDAYLLLDRVLAREEAALEWSTLRTELLELLKSTQFPAASAPTTLTLPVVFGGPLK